MSKFKYAAKGTEETSGHLTQADNKKIIANGQKYNTLQEAYDAYEKELTDGKYKQYKNTLQ